MVNQEQSESFFNERLKPVLEEVEILRKEILEKGKRNKLLLSGGGILIFLYSYSWVQEWADTPFQKFWMSALLIILLVTGYMAIRPEMFLPKTERNRLYNLYKNGIIREIVRFVNKSFNYQPIFKTNIRLFDKSKLFPNKITEYKETYGIVGVVHDVELKISEIQLRNMLMPYFEGWFVNFDVEYDLPDFVLHTSPVAVEKNSKFEGFIQEQFEGVQILISKNAGIPEECKMLADLIKRHTVKNAKSISLSVIEKRLFLAIENEGLMFQLSFRDDNQNYIGSYVDFTHTGSVNNFMEELVEKLKPYEKAAF